MAGRHARADRAFLAAGFIKGVVGLGLPTIVLGMLAIPLGVTQAIAVLLVPSLVTNGVQDLSGPARSTPAAVFGRFC